jgi:type I restriction enzyme S subunit
MSLLPINSLSVVCIASIGKIGILTHKCITNQQINSIIIDESKYNVNYMYYALSNMTKKLISTAGNVVVPIIKKSLFEKFLIKIPKFEEQNSIANILSEFDNKIDLHKMQKEHYKNIKYGLMNDLLTGKKRVKIN